MSTTSETRTTRSNAPLSEPRAADPTSSIADPGPLGLAAFALTTFVLSLFNAGLAPEALESAVLPLALFYGGLAQLLAGMWEFRKANTFGATAFVSYGAFWLSFAAYVQFVEPTLPEAQHTTATGLFLIGWAVFTGYMLIASLRTTGALVAVFGGLFLTFLFLAVGDLLGVDGIATIGGYFGLLTALAAWYASFAVVTNATWGRQVLPTAPR
ncbi:acetate uptake transporter [Actinomycetospora termitidis]|uniref:Acetate uptake transporter n=1 Tax=Actinomycetospora termitidis TaxID=3053470 RepID=A0ABT7MH90_9PSEU|nr:acetate uptake transporter [Actinomycetospora sp. Odt1-22]MDL5159539.1 acetate uptake transporter [Actinomycetospora sp. Odt1-22]